MRVTQQRAVVAASDEGSVKARCQVFLRLAGYSVNAKRVRRLVRLMGQEPVHPKPRLSVAGQGSMRYPYLLRERVLYAPHEVWSTDITYVPMAKDVFYLVAVLDWHTRYVPSWELSNTLDVGFCLRTLATHPAPYHTSSIPTKAANLSASPLSRPCWLPAAKSAATGAAGPMTMPYAFIERLWRSVNWECVYLNLAIDDQHLYEQLHAYFTYSNHQRPHQELNGQTPAQVFA